MKEASPRTIYLKDYTPPAFDVEHIDPLEILKGVVHLFELLQRGAGPQFLCKPGRV